MVLVLVDSQASDIVRYGVIDYASRTGDNGFSIRAGWVAMDFDVAGALKSAKVGLSMTFNRDCP